jgi:predicted SAM-dependent methyltransferase
MRLHIGASRIQLAMPKLAALRTADWIHLGAPESIEESIAAAASELDDMSRVLGQYLSFYYKKGNILPFSDSFFTFAFSEHFFEHLFLDEAGELLKECFRVLQPGACLRIAVPDADLRTYMAPEPAAYTTGDDRWIHPDKHKTRWSIYSLSYVLEQIGFVTRGVVFCDKYGQYHVGTSIATDPFYQDCLEREFVTQTGFIDRFCDSLIVDAKKPRRVGS